MKVKPLLNKINLSTFLRDYLNACGIKDVDNFLNPEEYCFDSPWDYPNMGKAVYLLHSSQDKKIGVLVDSDCDGNMSAAMIVNFLVKSIEITPVVLFHKGKAHGLRKNIDENLVAEVIEQGIELLIIPDAGTNDAQECHELKCHNVNVLILDHHEITTENNDAVIVNHHLGAGLNTALSGTGVTHKFIYAYCYKFGLTIPQYQDMVAISLISDVCDLSVLENRTYIELGLKNITNPMIKLMVDKLNRKGVNPEGCSWGLIPPINSLCRSDNQEGKEVFFNALSGTGDIGKGLYWARKAHREQTNTVKDMYAEIEPNLDLDHKAIVSFCSPENKSYIGLVANKILGQYGKPTILLREMNSTTWTGSVRSPIPLASKINDTKLASCQGHQEACGIFVKKSNLNKFQNWLDTLDLSVCPAVDVAGIINVDDITTELCEICDDWKILWGHGVESPVFYCKFTVTQPEISIYRKSTNTIKVTHNGVSFIKFFCNDTMCSEFENVDKAEIEMVVKLSVNEFNGCRNPQGEILQYEIHKVEEKEIKSWEDFF